ncbi:hypothetical protein [Sphingobacterium faecale]|nr:hypothetical protein [Sphingobacterium faecale]
MNYVRKERKIESGTEKDDAIGLKDRSVFEFDKDGKIWRLTDIA